MRIIKSLHAIISNNGPTFMQQQQEEHFCFKMFQGHLLIKSKDDSFLSMKNKWTKLEQFVVVFI